MVSVVQHAFHMCLYSMYYMVLGAGPVLLRSYGVYHIVCSFDFFQGLIGKKLQ